MDRKEEAMNWFLSQKPVDPKTFSNKDDRIVMQLICQAHGVKF